MPLLPRLTGRGRIFVRGVDMGEIDYMLEGVVVGANQLANGVLSGNAAAIVKAAQEDHARLVLDNGVALNVCVHAAGGRPATFTLKAPIPDLAALGAPLV